MWFFCFTTAGANVPRFDTAYPRASKTFVTVPGQSKSKSQGPGSNLTTKNLRGKDTHLLLECFSSCKVKLPVRRRPYYIPNTYYIPGNGLMDFHQNTSVTVG